ncbi:Hypothetical predicted protein [Cloeon dipterum]|uniref:Uncharacterized protein n=1 Tax=Cloeon dipterum TaxID=197152 RepID=A0A8S1CCP2_9INSE|nr:Hypothetical predicted protein [Cloeon dipterum]
MMTISYPYSSTALRPSMLYICKAFPVGTLPGLNNILLSAGRVRTNQETAATALRLSSDPCPTSKGQVHSMNQKALKEESGKRKRMICEREAGECRPARGERCSRSSFNPLIIPEPDPCPQLTLKTAMQP